MPVLVPMEVVVAVEIRGRHGGGPEGTSRPRNNHLHVEEMARNIKKVFKIQEILHQRLLQEVEIRIIISSRVRVEI